MKKRLFFRQFIIALILMSIISCAKENTVYPNGESQDGKVEIYLSTPIRNQVSTRSIISDEIVDKTSVYILVFDGDKPDSRLLDIQLATEDKIPGSLTVSLNEQENACHCFIIANCKEAMVAVNSWDLNDGLTFDWVKKNLITVPLTSSSNIITQMPTIQPMVGSISLPDGINRGTTIGTKTHPVSLIRRTAKITIENQTSESSNFILIGATMNNVPDRGTIFSNSLALPDGVNYLSYKTEPGLMVGVRADNDKVTEPLYCYEVPKEKETSIILCAKYNGSNWYYRLDMIDKERINRFNLLGNYHYTIIIDKILKEGYATLSEAATNPPSNNLLYDIVVTDTDSHDILTNGKEYLGVSNSEFWLFETNRTNIYSFATYDADAKYVATVLTYTTKDNITECTIVSSIDKLRFTDPGEGVGGPPDPYLKFTTSMTLPATTAGTMVRKEIKIWVDDAFTEGEITITVGDLTKIIKVKRKIPISAAGEVINLGKGYTFVQIDKQYALQLDRRLEIMDYDRKFLSISTSPNKQSNSSKSIAVSKLDNLYASFKKVSELEEFDISDSWGFTNYAEVYADRASEGRLKMHIVQEAYYNFARDGRDIGDQYSQAFWQNNQKGERLIRMRSRANYHWQARVIAGTDFIRLSYMDMKRSQSDIANSDAESYLVISDSTFIKSPGNQDIYSPYSYHFRIGLTDYNTTGKNRYGMVLLTVFDPNKPYSIAICVRQGDNPEPIEDPATLSSEDRALYRNFVVYNMTLKDHSKVTNSALYTDYPKLASDDFAFTDYPSKAGGLFQWCNGMIFPTSAPKQINNWTYEYSADNNIKICPPGYRLPKGDKNNPNVGTQNEFSASLPFKSTVYTSYSGSMNAHCADGYYDRKTGIAGENYTNGWDSALGGGTVFWDKKTYRSIFFSKPYSIASGAISNTSDGYWGEFINNTTNQEFTVIGNSSFFKDKANAHMVRCVKE